jgi:hypothetical protein
VKLKDSLRRALVHARHVSEDLLKAFRSPGDWTHQVCPGANHALWFAGHMGVVDNYFIAAIDPTHARNMPGYEEKFSMGTQPTARPQDYPAVDEVLAYMRERRGVLLAVLEAETDESLSRPTQPGTPRFLPDVASVFEAAVWHEGLHAGQMSVARRGLGHGPLH